MGVVMGLLPPRHVVAEQPVHDRATSGDPALGREHRLPLHMPEEAMNATTARRAIIEDNPPAPLELCEDCGKDESMCVCLTGLKRTGAALDEAIAKRDRLFASPHVTVSIDDLRQAERAVRNARRWYLHIIEENTGQSGTDLLRRLHP
jgi:hypothetical protein